MLVNIVWWCFRGQASEQHGAPKWGARLGFHAMQRVLEFLVRGMFGALGERGAKELYSSGGGQEYRFLSWEMLLLTSAFTLHLPFFPSCAHHAHRYSSGFPATGQHDVFEILETVNGKMCLYVCRESEKNIKRVSAHSRFAEYLGNNRKM